MEKIPAQTTKNSKGRRVAPSTSTMDTLTKLGMDKLSAHQKSEMVRNYYSRRQLCRVPEDILAKNPDKEFVWISMNKLEKTGMWHPEGYRLYKTPVDSENMNKDKFDKTHDGLVHRNEMVLAYLDKSEYQEREMERALVRATRKHTDILTQSDSLRGFAPHAEEIVQQVNIKGE